MEYNFITPIEFLKYAQSLQEQENFLKNKDRVKYLEF